jgi:primosomal protein N' (replication factor Y)
MPADALIVHVAPLTDAVTGVLSYLVPDDLKGKVSEGVVVIVPLRNRLVAGVVMSMSEELPEKPYVLKPVHMVVDEQPALNSTQLALARWMAREYCAPLGRCCGMMVPPGFTPSTAYVYALAKEDMPVPAPGTIHDARAQIIDVLHRHGPLVESKLKLALKGVKRWRGALRGLVQAGVVLRSSTLAPAISRPRRTTLAQMALSEMTLEIVFANLEQEAARMPRRANAIHRRMAVLGYLQDHNRMAWADWVFAETGANRADLDWLAERNYIMLGDAERWRDPLADIDYVTATAPPLTADQARAWEAVRAAMLAEGGGGAEEPVSAGDREQGSEVAQARSAEPLRRSAAQFLVRGVTGSGKTEVYMRAVELALQRGCGALVLVPEISLTPQTARRFLSRFPGQVTLIHSRLKPGERFDTWRRIRAGELKVVVGARSALFAPLLNVGVIVLDEEHDQSYKQNSPPYYDTRRVAMRYAQLSGATLLLGSATPSLEAWQMARTGILKVLELPNRVRGHIRRVNDQQTRLGVQAVAQRETDSVVYQPLPDVQVVDMRAELRGGNMSMFSGALMLALSETLQRGEQAILFLNRRGSASCVICRQCGYALRCPNDDVPLTYHQVNDAATGGMAGKHGAREQEGAILKCHQCNHVERVPTRCPSCGSARIRFIGIGTQKVEAAIHEHFPHARIVRWDKDASSGAGSSSADQLLQRFVNQQADVLVGTQMIAKGLDLPLVTLVGVVLADVGLFLPDFRSSERVFDLIEQVAGRAGRSLLAGRVIVQTYNPEHPAIAYAAHHDVAGFARDELQQRQALNLPPYVRLVRFEVSDEDNGKARQACEALARQLRMRVGEPGALIGPAQAYFARRSRRYRWHLFVRTHSPRQLLDDLDLPRGCVVDVDPVSIL